MKIIIDEELNGNKRFSTTLKKETVAKLKSMKEELKRDNPRITYSILTEMAFEALFKKYNLKECEIEDTIPVIVKKKGYKVSYE